MRELKARILGIVMSMKSTWLREHSLMLLQKIGWIDEWRAF